MNRKALRIIFAAVLPVVVACVVGANTRAVKTTDSAIDANNSTPAAAAGYRIYIDPATGRILESPAKDAASLPMSAQMRNALSTSSDGLVSEPSPVPGGGYMIRLQGRFQNAMVVTIDGDGTRQAPCITGLPARPNTSDDLTTTNEEE